MGLRSFGNVIGGKRVAASDGGVIESVEPATGVPWASIPRSRTGDVGRAVSAARDAFPGWWGLPALGRAAHLRSLAELVRSHAAELATIESRDVGRVARETAAGDLPACTEMLHFFAGMADKIHGDTVNVGPASFNFTRREPYGVVGIIVPWNAPLSIACAKVGAALAAGNTVVVKPAEEAGCSISYLAELIAESGFPDGVLNVVNGIGEEAGQALVRHPGVGRLTFTGSTDTARTITAQSAPTLKPLHFELGGKSPNIVFADADLEAAAVGVSTAAVYTGGAGQTCIAGSRILLHASIFDEMVERIRTHAASVVLGDPTDHATTMGPLVSEAQYRRVMGYLEEGRHEGRLVFGGRGAPDLFPADSPYSRGWFVEPTLFAVDGNDHRICREEIFGPVAAAMPFETEEEAVALANDSSYGLAAGVWTSDLGRAHRMVRDLDAGSVWVNAYRRIHWGLPFGGFKESGYGKDSGLEGILENTRIKTAWIDLGQSS